MRSTVITAALLTLGLGGGMLGAAGGGGQGPDPARAGRPLAIEDYYRLQAISSPQISPGGKWVVFTVATRVEDDNSTRSETYLAAVDRSAPPARVLHYGRDVTGPRFTRDGLLQYSAGGQWQIDPDRPAAPPMPAPPSAAGAEPSPDGRWVASLKDKTVPRREALTRTEFERRHDQRFKGAIFDWKDYVRDGQPLPTPDPRLTPARQIVLTPAAGGEPKVLVDLDMRPESLAWHPDNGSLAFVADSHWRDELAYDRPDLWTVTVDGKLTRVTDDGYDHSAPSFSPDGKYLLYTRTPGTDLVIGQKLNHGGPTDLFVRPAGGGEPINLTARWDLQPGQARWSPDSRYVYFPAAIGGESHLFRVSVPGAQVEQVTKGPRRLQSLTIDRAFKSMAYLVGSNEAPSELYAASIDGSGERRLTDVHGRLLSEVSLCRTERLEWASYDGTKIEGWLTFPYGFDPAKGRYPLIVFSHGGPHSATGYTFDFKKQWFAANGYFVLDTNFRSSTGYGEAFLWATWGEWGRKDGEDIVSGIDDVVRRQPIDPKRVGHIGHSYGGFLSNWLVTQYPDRFAAAATGAGITNWVSDYGTADIYRTKETEFFGPPWDAAARERMIKQSPLTYAGRVKTPMLFVHGEVDYRVPFPEGEQMFFALRRQGIPAKMIQYAGQPHGIAGSWNAIHRMLNELRWFDTYLKG